VKYSQSKFLMLTISVCLLASCAKQIYQAKPLDRAQTTAKLLNKDASGNDFQAYLIKQGYQASQLPFADWGLVTLLD
jgi:hypothetical protein